MASCGPSQAAKYISQTLVVSSINRPVLQYLNYLGCINPNYITQTDINHPTKCYYDSGRVLTSENLIALLRGGITFIPGK